MMSYGPNWPSIFRNVALYTDKILKGAKPADLPAQQPTEFDLVFNLKTAKAIGQTNDARRCLAVAHQAFDHSIAILAPFKTRNPGWRDEIERLLQKAGTD